MESRALKIPVGVIRPVRIVELVLNEEKPHARCGAQQGDGNVHKQEGPDANRPHHQARSEGDAKVGRHCADPGTPTGTHQASGDSMADQEQVGRPQAEHNERVAIETVANPPPAR